MFGGDPANHPLEKLNEVWKYVFTHLLLKQFILKNMFE